MSIGIDFVLRANSAAFTKGLASVNNSMKDLKKGLREFDVGNGLKNALGVGGIIAGFRMAITNAQELRDEADKMGRSIDSSTNSVAQLGDAVAGIGKSFKNTLTEGLSFFTQIGDKARHFFQGVTQAQEDAARKMVAETGKSADEAEKRLKASREANSPEKMAVAQEKLNKAEREADIRGTDAEKKLVSLINERADLEGKLAKTAKNTVAAIDLKTAIAENVNAIREANKAIDKEEESKKEKKAKDNEAIDKEEESKKEKKAKDNEAVAKKNKDLVGRFGLSVEEMAAQELGGFTDGNDPRLKARKILADEEKARTLFGRGDFKGGLAAAQAAQGARQALENQMAGIKEIGGKAPPTAEQMDELIKAVGGIIKAQP
jgi:hypothetical protein